MHCDGGLIIVIVYYFQIWNKKEHIISSWVINSHMCPMYIETPYISRVISSHMCPMYIETHYIIRVISSHIGPMYIETPYICSY